jgi:hypothetical protein
MKTYLSASLTAGNNTIGQSNSVYYGYNCTVITAVGAINIRKTSITGQIIDVIPSGTLAGASKDFSYGSAMDGPIFVEFAGGATGTVVIKYE